MSPAYNSMLNSRQLSKIENIHLTKIFVYMLFNKYEI